MEKYNFEFKKYTIANISSNDRLLAAAASNGVTVFDFPSMGKIAIFKEIKNPFYTYFSSDNKLLAVKSTLGVIGLFDIEKKVFISKYRRASNSGDGSNILFTPDNRYIIDGDWAGNIRLVDIVDGKIIYLEKNFNTMIMNIDYDDQEHTFHIQKYYRGGQSILDKSYSVISRWRYDLKNKEMIHVDETNKIIRNSSSISYNSVLNQYITFQYPPPPPLRRIGIAVYDGFLNEIISTFDIGLYKYSTHNNSVSKDGKWFITLIDNQVNIFSVKDFYIVKKITLMPEGVNQLRLTQSGKYIIMNCCILKDLNEGRVHIISLADLDDGQL